MRAKAAATRHLAKFALEIVVTHGTGETDDRLMLAVIQLLCKFYDMLDQGSHFFNEEFRREMPKLGGRLAYLYQQLSARAYGQGLKLWKMSPKLHLFVHLCEIQCVMYGNPRYYWTYADEDLVGMMVEIAETCHPATMAFTVLFKWMHVFFDKEE